MTTDPVVLGQAAGTYRDRAPLDALRPHFARTWCNRIRPGSTRELAIVPDGHIDLQWVDGALRVAGPDRQANIEPLPGGATVIGLRFQPGAAPAWLRVPASEIVDQRLPLEAFWGREARHAEDWIGEARTPGAVARRLEAVLARRAAALALDSDALSRPIFELLQPGRPPETGLVPLLRDRLDVSERSLRRRCHEAFGYGPRTLDRILRFQRFLQLARRSAEAGLADLAAAAGYSDQAHLTREARRLAGLTPSAVTLQLAP